MKADKPTPILPPGQAEERPLFVIMVIMAFLASLTLMTALMGLRQSASWQNDLNSSATLQIVADTPEALQTQTDQALIILKAAPGIKSAAQLSDAENRALLNPWIGELGLPDDIQIPVLIRVKADYKKLDEAALNQKLAEAGVNAKLDNHTRWSRNLATTWQRMRTALIGLLLLMVVATVAISSFATQSVLRARENIINVLGQVGATDQFIARLFVTRFLSLGFKAAMSGMVLALIFVGVFMMWQNFGTDGDGLKIGFAFSDIIWLLSLAVVIGVISAATAGRSARLTIQSQRPLS